MSLRDDEESPAVSVNRRGSAGFTMIEIAMAVAVIAFALVAIVGLLPLGMETQRDNRQETIINHDGAYLLEALRGAAPNLNDLAQFVDSVNGQPWSSPPNTSADLLRALSVVNRTNVIRMRSITGAAALRSPAVANFAMRYEVRSLVRRVDAGPNSIDMTAPYASALADHLYEVRLAFFWPITPAGQVPDAARHQVFRTVVSGDVDANGLLNTSLFEKK
jgi:hypothetical protein